MRVPGPLFPTALAYTLAWGVSAWTIHQGIQGSAGSTSAIGYLFLPFLASWMALPWGLLGLAAGLVARAIERPSRRAVVLAALVGVPAGAWTVSTAVDAAHTARVIDRVVAIRGMTRAEVDTWVATDDPLRQDRYVLAALATNEATSAEVLAWIASLPDPALHRAQGSLRSELSRDNPHGLAVMRLVARHPAITPKILRGLARSPDDYVAGDVAGNRRTPPDVLEALFAEPRESAYLVWWGLARNPSTPQHVLDALRPLDDRTLQTLLEARQAP